MNPTTTATGTAAAMVTAVTEFAHWLILGCPASEAQAAAAAIGVMVVYLAHVGREWPKKASPAAPPAPAADTAPQPTEVPHA